MTKQNRWTLNEINSEITFSIRHLKVAEVHGRFNTFDAIIYTTDKNFTTAVISLWIDVGSLCSGDNIQDEHLTSSALFDAQNHKQITFHSSSIEKSALEGTFEMWGDLTIKGIAKKIKLNVQSANLTTDLAGNENTRFKITGLINRNNWGLVWNKSIESGGWMVSEDITLLCELELTNTFLKKEQIELTPLANFAGIF